MGSDITKDRQADGELMISPRTVSRLRLRWRFMAGSGRLIWRRSLGELTGLNGTGVVVNVTVSRTTPAVAGDLLIVGTYGPAVVIAVSRFDGRLVWSTTLDPRPRAQITASGTAYSGSIT